MIQKSLSLISTKFRWQLIIISISLIAIVLALVLKITSISSPNLPLMIAMILGGAPLIIQILLKLFKGDFGADLLAAIALITSFILNQYLAGVIIILMLAGGQTLETYAMRKASSVLLALAERMPTFVHLRTNSDIKDIPLINIKLIMRSLSIHTKPVP